MGELSIIGFSAVYILSSLISTQYIYHLHTTYVRPTYSIRSLPYHTTPYIHISVCVAMTSSPIYKGMDLLLEHYVCLWDA